MAGLMVAGRYRVEKKLGAGGMGIVYEALDEHTGRAVALKVLLTEAADAEEQQRFMQRFEREARVAGGLDTPHVVRVLDAGLDAASANRYIVMERLEGYDLGALLDRVGALPVAVALKIAAQAALGLVAAHQHGVLHRDIKPSNLFLAVATDGWVTVKLVDFGLAKLALANDPVKVTRTGQLVGTPLYLAPEQARGAAQDHRSDLFSLGVVLYRMLSGRTPRDLSVGLLDFLATLCSEPAPPLRLRAPWVPVEVASLVHALLEIEPARRPVTPGVLLDHLRQMVPDGRLHESELSSVAPPQAGLREAPTLSAPGIGVVPRHSGELASESMQRRRRRLWWVAGSLGLALLAAVALLLSRGR